MKGNKLLKKKKTRKILSYYNPITSESIKIEWSAINDE